MPDTKNFKTVLTAYKTIQVKDPIKSHITIVDTFRGLASLMVVIFHYVCTTDYFTNDFLLQSFEWGRKGVQIFFIISGIVIPISLLKSNYKPSKFFKFLWKRVLRIEPPYIVALALVIFYLYIRNFIPGATQVFEDFSFKRIALHIGYLIPFFREYGWFNDVFWTLAIEFQYYLYLALIFPLVIQRKLAYRITFYLLLIVPSFIYVDKLWVEFFPFWSPYFLIGIAYALFFMNEIKRKEWLIITGIAGICVLYQNGIVGEANGIKSNGYFDVFIALGVVCITYFYADYKNKYTQFLGKISYSLYVIHYFTGGPIVNFLSHKFTLWYQKPFVVLIGIAVSIACSYILYLLVERPSQNMSKKISLN
jgi:peptidoglycan/LPS O-acetylase OafA/YrhL